MTTQWIPNLGWTDAPSRADMYETPEEYTRAVDELRRRIYRIHEYAEVVEIEASEPDVTARDLARWVGRLKNALRKADEAMYALDGKGVTPDQMRQIADETPAAYDGDPVYTIAEAEAILAAGERRLDELGGDA